MSLPITVSGSLAAAEVAFDARFMRAYQSVTPLHPRVATVATSSNRVQNYPIQSRIAKLRKWEGERQVQNAKAYSYSLTNEKYELTLGIPVEDFEDDQLGVYMATIDDMGEQAKLWPDDLTFAAIRAGESNAGYDGQNFFSTAGHALKSGVTIRNLFASTALTRDNYAAIRETMQSWTGEDGESLRVVPDLLVVPPALEQVGREILMAQYLDNTGGTATKSNVWMGTADLLVVPQLSTAAGGDDASYYLLCTKRAVKPFLFQLRKAPQFAQKTNLSDESVFNEDQLTYGVRARGAAGYGPFWLAAKGKSGA
jgi:phage major head subunit gpT-like protein